MPIPTPTVIATGFADALGCDYHELSGRLIIADAGNGTISAVNVTTHVHTVLGTGYHSLDDVVLSVDGVHAYVIDRAAGGVGTLMRVALASANRAAAHVIASLPNQPGQIALDEAHGYAYLPEFRPGGRLIRVNLATGAHVPVATGLDDVRGLLMTSDGRFAYVSEDTGRIRRFDLATNTNIEIASGLAGPRYMTWADAGESVILLAAHSPTPGVVLKIDLTVSPPHVTEIAQGTPHDPYDVAVLSPEKLLIVSADAVSEVNLTASVYTPAGDIFLGVGFVPNNRITGGYADTTVDPSYFFQVKDSPFGGTLPLMINHEKARSMGANFYQVMVSGPTGPEVASTQSYSDYRWNTALNQFELVTITPTGGFYPLHGAGEVWYNFWLGMRLDTSAQPNALNHVRIALFAAQNPATQIGADTDPGRGISVMIDNTVPTAKIDHIWHETPPNEVPVCAIITSGSPLFTFSVTAEAPRHLRAWSLTALWGDNQFLSVSQDDYSHHITPSRIWTGIHNTLVPSSPWNAAVSTDPSSTHCAHTFDLEVVDRVIDGYYYVHGSVSYHKSITIML
jgi:hypothetical protein